MTIYLLKVTLCLVLLLAVYHFFLEREKMHKFNRFYLLFGLVFSFLVPFLVLELKPETVLPLKGEQYIINHVKQVASNAPSKNSSGESGNLQLVLILVYFVVTAVFIFRYVKNIVRFLKKVSENEVADYQGAKLVLTSEERTSYTFLNFIFISKGLYEQGNGKKLILTHELAHVRQKHSLDILFIELLRSFFWFHPILPLYKKALQLNHEFLADDAVVRVCKDVKEYQLLLLDAVNIAKPAMLCSSFTYSVTRKRLQMMTHSYIGSKILLKEAGVVPLIGAALFLFSTKQQAVSELLNPTDLKKIVRKSEGPLLKLKSQGAENKALQASSRRTEDDLASLSMSFNTTQDAPKTPLDTARKELPVRQESTSFQTLPEFSNGVFISDTEVKLSLDKNTTREQLEDYQELLLKNNILFEVKKIEYYESGKIKRIKAIVICPDFSGDIERYFEGDETTGFSRKYVPDGGTTRQLFHVF